MLASCRTVSAITSGLKQVNWPGRLQLLQRSPLVIVDGAHNAYSMKKLVEAIQTLFIYQKCHVIFGTSCDKDIYGMVKILGPIANTVTITSDLDCIEIIRYKTVGGFLLGIELISQQGTQCGEIDENDDGVLGPYTVTQSSLTVTVTDPELNPPTAVFLFSRVQ